MWPRLTKKWKFHQWINWNYPANFGHSTKKWTNASRTILWLVKGDPEFCRQPGSQGVLEPVGTVAVLVVSRGAVAGDHVELTPLQDVVEGVPAGTAGEGAAQQEEYDDRARHNADSICPR